MRSRQWIYLFATVVSIAFSGGAFAQGGPASVVTATIEKRDVATGRQFVGTIVPLRISNVGSAVDGRVIEYPIDEGDRVTRGQTLTQLLTQTLEIELAAAQAELDLRREELAELENGSRPEEIEQARAAMLAAEAQRDYAQQDFERVNRLRETGRASADEFNESSAAAKETLNNYLERKSNYELIKAGPRKERIAQAKARVAAQEAEVQRIEDQIKKHTLIAPFDGYISSKNAQRGEWVSRSQVVATVIELDVVEVQTPVVEDVAVRLKLGAEARVEIPALADRIFAGVISKIVPQADARSRSIPVFVQLENELVDDQPLIRSGMFARVTLPAGTREQVTLAPKDAIVLGGPTPTVYVVVAPESEGQPPTVRPVSVQLGVTDAGWIQVIGDVHAGQQVVVLGNERIRPGQAIRITESRSADASNAKPSLLKRSPGKSSEGDAQ